MPFQKIPNECSNAVEPFAIKWISLRRILLVFFIPLNAWSANTFASIPLPTCVLQCGFLFSFVVFKIFQTFLRTYQKVRLISWTRTRTEPDSIAAHENRKLNDYDYICNLLRPRQCIRHAEYSRYKRSIISWPVSLSAQHLIVVLSLCRSLAAMSFARDVRVFRMKTTAGAAQKWKTSGFAQSFYACIWSNGLHSRPLYRTLMKHIYNYYMFIWIDSLIETKHSQMKWRNSLFFFAGCLFASSSLIEMQF